MIEKPKISVHTSAARAAAVAKYNASHPEKVAESQRRYRAANSERLKANLKGYYQANAESENLRCREYKLKNREAISAYNKLYREKNRDALRIKKKQRMSTDVAYRLQEALRSRLRACVTRKGKRKSASTMDLAGCSILQLKAHLENLFQPGMDWSNYGHKGWHIDHKLPCSSFDLSIPEQQRACFHWTNLQPLWAADNYAKHDKIPA